MVIYCPSFTSLTKTLSKTTYNLDLEGVAIRRKDPWTRLWMPRTRVDERQP
jgi:hypothetical protein